MNIEEYLDKFLKFRKYIPTEINLNADFIHALTIYRLGKGEINASILDECQKKYNKAWKKLFTLKIILKEEEQEPVPLSAKEIFISFLEERVTYDEKESTDGYLVYDANIINFKKTAIEPPFKTAFNTLLETQIPNVIFTETSPNDYTAEHKGYYKVTREEVLDTLYSEHAPEILKQFRIIKATIDKALRFCEIKGLITNTHMGSRLGIKWKYIDIIKDAFKLFEENGAIAPVQYETEQAKPWMRIFSNDPSREKSEYYRWILKTKQGKTNKSAILYLFLNLHKLKVITTQNEYRIYKVLSSCFRDSENLMLTFTKENFRNAKQTRTSLGWLNDFVDEIPVLKDKADKKNKSLGNDSFV